MKFFPHPEDLLNKDLVSPSVDSSNTATLFHGTNGLFGDCSIDRDVISSKVEPYGLLSFLSAYPTNIETVRYATITGFTEDEAEEPVEPCEDAPTGTYAGCVLEADFGRIARQTKTIEIDEVIRRANRGDLDFYLRGTLSAQETHALMTQRLSEADALNIVTRTEMIGVGNMLNRKISRMLWNGDPTNNTAGGGYKEFTGIDLRVTTGITNAIDSQPCPDMDSIVEDQNFTVFDTNALSWFIELEAYMTTFGQDTGLMPKWAIVMHPQLWRCFVDVWTCNYDTNRCGTSNYTKNDDYPTQLRNTMLRTQSVEINGHTYKVILDSAMPLLNATTNPLDLTGNQIAGNIYWLPFTILNNFPVLYMEYMNYGLAAKELAALRGHNMFWTDDGKFMWTMEQVKYCYNLMAKIEPRLVLRTPQFAAKLTNVMCEPLIPFRSAY